MSKLITFEDDKDEENLERHRCRLMAGAGVLFDELAKEELDDAKGEERWVKIGLNDEGKYMKVCYAENETTIRLISARYLEPKEVRRYEKENE